MNLVGKVETLTEDERDYLLNILSTSMPGIHIGSLPFLTKGVVRNALRIRSSFLTRSRGSSWTEKEVTMERKKIQNIAKKLGFQVWSTYRNGTVVK